MDNSIPIPVTDEERDAFKASVRSGDAGLVETMLSSSAALRVNIDAPWFAFDSRATSTAARLAKIDVLDVLLRYGADINLKSAWWAGGFGLVDGNRLDRVDELVARGYMLTVHDLAALGRVNELAAMLDRDPALLDARGGDGGTPLHFAKDAPTTRLLLDRGADMTIRDIDHVSTAGEYAVGESAEKLRLLIEYGEPLDTFKAVYLGDTALLRSYLHSNPDQARIRVGDPPIFSPGSEGGHIYCFRASMTPIHSAARWNMPDAISVLVDYGADVNCGDGYDNGTPLHVAAWNNSAGAIRALIDGGADIDRKSGPVHNNEAVGWAIVSGSVEAVKALVDAGATIHDHHRQSVQAGLEGKLTDFSPGTKSQFEAIAAILR